MRPALAAALFWSGVSAALVAIGLIAAGRGPIDEALPLVAAGGYIVVGRLLTVRRPGNLVSFVIATVGLILALTSVTDSYLKGASAGDQALLLKLTALLNALIWNVWLWALVAIALPLLFPRGRLPSPRWRWIVWVAGLGTALNTLASLFDPGVIAATAGHHLVNPLGLAGADAAMSALGSVGGALQGVGAVGALTAIVVRLRRSHGIERLQLKWFAYVAGVLVACLPILALISSFDQTSGVIEIAGPVVWFTALAMIGFGVPLATGVAVLRYRLYEIDVVINRTLVYGALTATLAATYLGSVLLLQVALGPVTSGSSLAVAVSTLGVAALFGPARARIQAAVDRRFYRRKYDAARTLERFSARLREQVDLDALGGELRSVVDETMQPAHVSLWLRAP